MSMKLDERILDEVYFSVDGEFDGTHPPRHSMLSVAAVAYTLRKGVIGEFSRNIFALTGDANHFGSNESKERRSAWLESIGLPTGHTMEKRVWDEFWVKHPKAWAATLEDRVVPAVAMNDFKTFYHEHAEPRAGVFIEYPGAIDYFWCHWYFMEFIGEDPFGHSGQMGIKGYASAVLHRALRHSTNRNMPKGWSASKLPHTHIALDDARQQAHLAIRMQCEHLGLELPPL